jgi:hypothetical protein
MFNFNLYYITIPLHKIWLGSLVVEQGTHNPKVTGSIPVRANSSITSEFVKYA